MALISLLNEPPTTPLTTAPHHKDEEEVSSMIIWLLAIINMPTCSFGEG